MVHTRVIPCLLLSGRGLVKTVKFKDPKYVGDPVNAVKIFNDKEADELILLDIDATKSNRGPAFDLIEDIASECFMPLCYGGGIRNLEDARKLFHLGVEKIALRAKAIQNPNLISEIASKYGSQAVVVAVDVKRNWLGHPKVVLPEIDSKVSLPLVETVQKMESLGAGEILVNSVDRDGTQTGYDLESLQTVVSAVGVPVIACGGAGSLDHMREAVNQTGVAAVSAGSLFVFHGRHRAVLINYPGASSLEKS